MAVWDAVSWVRAAVERLWCTLQTAVGVCDVLCAVWWLDVRLLLVGVVRFTLRSLYAPSPVIAVCHVSLALQTSFALTAVSAVQCMGRPLQHAAARGRSGAT